MWRLRWSSESGGHDNLASGDTADGDIDGGEVVQVEKCFSRLVQVAASHHQTLFSPNFHRYAQTLATFIKFTLLHIRSFISILNLHPSLINTETIFSRIIFNLDADLIRSGSICSIHYSLHEEINNSNWIICNQNMIRWESIQIHQLPGINLHNWLCNCRSFQINVEVIHTLFIVKYL